MQGVIGKREVLTHLGVIWREFGPRCALRCVWALLRGKRRPVTFLSVAFADAAKPRG